MLPTEMEKIRNTCYLTNILWLLFCEMFLFLFARKIFIYFCTNMLFTEAEAKIYMLVN